MCINVSAVPVEGLGVVCWNAKIGDLRFPYQSVGLHDRIWSSTVTFLVWGSYCSRDSGFSLPHPFVVMPTASSGIFPFFPS
jgi:hypothetical protein